MAALFVCIAVPVLSADLPRPLQPAVYNWGNFLIIPHIAAGGQWSAEIVVTGSRDFGITLYPDDPSKPFKIEGSVGTIVACGYGDTCLNGNLEGSGDSSASFSMASESGELTQGYAVLSKSPPGNPTGFAILRNTLPSGFVAEATETGMKSIFGLSPIGTGDAGPTKMIFDNTNGNVTSIALTDGEMSAPGATFYPTVPVQVDVVGSDGASLGSHVITLHQYEHSAFVLTDQFPETVNTRCTLLFSAKPATFLGGGWYPPPVAVMGQRWYVNGSSQTFTTLPLTGGQ